MVREPAVAGQFYKGTPELLKSEVEGYMAKTRKERVLGCVSPHAGLMYSGHVAGAVYSRLEIPETVVLIGPNHTGLGRSISVFPDGEWTIPLKRFSVDAEFAHKVCLYAGGIAEKDYQAHLFEHSLEVQLPFLSLAREEPPLIVPIAMMQASVDDCRSLGEAIAMTRENTGRDMLVIASSDMSHYVPDSEARRLDRMAIERILEIDPVGLYQTVISRRISMCGYLPVATMLFAAKKMGAVEAELVKYATSGDVSGDYGHVVGYAGIIVK
jgi:hypothetical protein